MKYINMGGVFYLKRGRWRESGVSRICIYRVYSRTLGCLVNCTSGEMITFTAYAFDEMATWFAFVCASARGGIRIYVSRLCACVGICMFYGTKEIVYERKTEFKQFCLANFYNVNIISGKTLALDLILFNLINILSMKNDSNDWISLRAVHTTTRLYSKDC